MKYLSLFFFAFTALHGQIETSATSLFKDSTISEFHYSTIPTFLQISVQNGKGSIKVNCSTGDVSFDNVNPDYASLEFWRGLTAAFPEIKRQVLDAARREESHVSGGNAVPIKATSATTYYDLYITGTVHSPWLTVQPKTPPLVTDYAYMPAFDYEPENSMAIVTAEPTVEKTGPHTWRITFKAEASK